MCGVLAHRPLCSLLQALKIAVDAFTINDLRMGHIGCWRRKDYYHAGAFALPRNAILISFVSSLWAAVCACSNIFWPCRRRCLATAWLLLVAISYPLLGRRAGGSAGSGAGAAAPGGGGAGVCNRLPEALWHGGSAARGCLLPPLQHPARDVPVPQHPLVSLPNLFRVSYSTIYPGSLGVQLWQVLATCVKSLRACFTYGAQQALYH